VKAIDPRLVVRRVRLDELRPDPANPRAHDEQNLDAIKASLARFGQVEPLVLQRGTNRLIAGHGRMTAMKALGWTDAEVVEIDVDDLQATALGIALNRSGELASWDEAVLGRLLTELRAAGAMDGVGFSNDEIDDMLAKLEVGANAFDEDEIPAPMDEAVSRRGDIWTLGNHRLACGDSASAEDVDLLLGGARIQLVNSDPPYNVKVEPRSNNAIAAGLSSFGGTHHQRFDAERNPKAAKATHRKLRPKDRPLMNDFLPEEEFDRLLRAWFGNFARVMEPGAGFFIWGGYANIFNYPAALREAGLYFSQTIIWLKGHPVLTRKDFMGAHEWAFYGWREGGAHRFYGPNNATDVWEIKKVNPQSMIHLTEKPVELAVRAIEYGSRRGENVLDLFGGSGSTLMGCEHTGRRAYLMELDPIYADVIVRRFEKATGKKAALAPSGKTFDEVAAERGAS
jgi:DNA modification methylase